MSRGIQNRAEASLTGGTSESLAPLPQGWSYVPLGALCSMVAGGTPQSDTDSYWGGNDDPQNTPWISISDMSQVDLVTSTEKYVTPLGLKSAGLNPGEIGTVLFAMYASVGEVAVSGISAVWNQALLGLIPLNTEILHSPFLYYALKTLKPHLPVYFRSNTQHNLNAGTVSRLRIPLPPLESQQRIADYLDRETAEIDAAVADLDKYVELLEQRRLFTVDEVLNSNEAVTSEWTEMSLKFVIRERFVGDWGGEPGTAEVDSVCVRVADFDRPTNTVNDQVPTTRSYSRAKYEAKRLQHHDILVERSGGGDKTPVGSAMLYTGGDEALCANFIEVVRLKEDQLPEYWVHILRREYMGRNTMRFVKQTTGIQNLDPQSFYDQKFPVPSLNEQHSLAEKLRQRTSEIDSLIAESTRLRDLLLKRRSVLITEVVTGRKQV